MYPSTYTPDVQSCAFFKDQKQQITLQILWVSYCFTWCKRMYVFLSLIDPSAWKTFQNVFFFISVCILCTSSSTWAGFQCGGSLSSPSWVGTGTIRKPINLQISQIFVTGTRRIDTPTAKVYLLLAKSLCSPHKRGRVSSQCCNLA